MKKTAFLLVALSVALACSRNTAKYDVTGSGLDDGVMVQLIDQITSEPIDSAVVSDGTFHLKGKACKDAFLTLSAEDADWEFPMFNDGTPVEVDFAEKTLIGSDLNFRLSECDRKTSDVYQDYNAFLEELVALPEAEQMARMPDRKSVV